MFKVNFDEAVDVHAVPTTSAADVLKETMKFHHITQTEFAERTAISQKQLSFILNRKAFMSVQVARQIEAATGMSAKWLLQLDFNYRFAHHTDDQLNPDVRPFDWAVEM
jgi:transcriptional regulator with XRE-family HTH domain